MECTMCDAHFEVVFFVYGLEVDYCPACGAYMLNKEEYEEEDSEED